MDKYKPGIKLMCVRTNYPELVKGKIYTLHKRIGDTPIIEVKEIPDKGYFLSRFTPVPTVRRKNNV